MLTSILKNPLTGSVRAGVLGLAIASILPLLALNIWQTYSAYSTALDVAQYKTFDAVKRASLSISAFLKEAGSTAKFYANRPYARHLDRNDCDPMAESLQLRQTRYSLFLTRDMNGKLICSSAPASPNVDSAYGLQNYLEEFKRGNPLVLGNITKGPITGRWFLGLGTPIHNADNQLIGFGILGLDLKNIEPVTGLDPSIVVSVLDTDRHILARTASSSESIGDISAVDISAIIVGSPENGVITRARIDDIDSIVAAVRVPSTDWIVIAHQPASVALGPVYQQLRRNAAILVVLIAAILALGWIFSNFIIRPIRTLADVTDRIHGGDLSARAPLKGPSEIQVVSAHLNGMLDQIVRSETKLRESRDLLNTIVDSTPASIFAFDMHHRFTLVSKGTAEFIGLPKDQVLGKTLHDIFPKNLADQLRATNAKIMATGESLAIEESIASPGKSEPRILATSKFTLSDSQGRVIGLGGVATDITERKATEEQLRQAQKLEAVGKLTGGVAHDFNNLLAIISGNLEMLGEDLADQPQMLKLLTPALRATRRGATLTRSLLAFSRQQPLSPKTFDPGRLLGDMMDLLGRTVPEHIQMRFVRPQRLWACEADPGQLQNALLNLVVNARDAMPSGGNLTIEVANASLTDSYVGKHPGIAAGEYIVLSVSDTGTGMPPEVLARVFEPFFTTKSPGAGTGLGLSMVYGFAKQSSGHVSIYSEVGHGTTVRIYLPKSKMEASAPTEPSVKTEHKNRGETILVVEDDADVRESVEIMLLRSGFKTVTVGTAEEALRVIHERPVALMLTDVILRGSMNGPALVTEVACVRPDIKVLYMSGYTENAVLNHGLEVGVHLLHKPFSHHDLTAKLAELLTAPPNGY
jgi:PAS domain S-box-containing protein